MRYSNGACPVPRFVETDDPCPMCNRGPIGAGELRIFPDAEVFLPLMGEE